MVHANQPHVGFDLIDGHAIDLEESLGTDHTWTGTTCNGTAGENVVFPNLCYLKIADGKFWKTDADAVATTEGILAIALETINANATGLFLLIGFIRDDDWDWTVQGAIFVGTDPGALTQTAPVGSGDQVRKAGYPMTADIMWFNPDSTVVQVA